MREVISACPEWRSQVDEALLTQFAHWLQDQYLAAMAFNILKVASLGMTFTKFWEECIVILRTRSRKAAKTTLATNIVKSNVSKADQPVTSANQRKRK